MAVWRFNSIEEFAAEAKWDLSTMPYHSYQDWYGYQTYEDCKRKALRGDDALVPKAQALIDKLESLEAEIPLPQWRASVAGAYPVVPEFLAGMPDCMRIRRPTISDMAPLSIYVSTTSSAMIGADTMMQRGVAILALLLKLQQVRPIQLYLLTELDGVTDGDHIQVIRVESQPLSVSVACFALTCVAFARHLTYGYAEHVDRYKGGWPRNYAGGGAGGHWEAILRKQVGMAPEDLYIPAATAWDEMVMHPVEWVNDKIKKYGRVEEM